MHLDRGNIKQKADAPNRQAANQKDPPPMGQTIITNSINLNQAEREAHISLTNTTTQV